MTSGGTKGTAVWSAEKYGWWTARRWDHIWTKNWTGPASGLAVAYDVHADPGAKPPGRVGKRKPGSAVYPSNGLQPEASTSFYVVTGPSSIASSGYGM